jgi:hypothetical protein
LKEPVPGIVVGGRILVFYGWFNCEASFDNKKVRQALPAALIREVLKPSSGD